MCTKHLRIPWYLTYQVGGRQAGKLGTVVPGAHGRPICRIRAGGGVRACPGATPNFCRENLQAKESFLLLLLHIQKRNFAKTL